MRLFQRGLCDNSAMTTGVLYNSLTFLLIAKRAAERIEAAQPLQPNKAEALVSITFASSALRGIHQRSFEPTYEELDAKRAPTQIRVNGNQ